MTSCIGDPARTNGDGGMKLTSTTATNRMMRRPLRTASTNAAPPTSSSSPIPASAPFLSTMAWTIHQAAPMTPNTAAAA